MILALCWHTTKCEGALYSSHLSSFKSVSVLLDNNRRALCENHATVWTLCTDIMNAVTSHCKSAACRNPFNAASYKTWHFIPTGKSFLRVWPTKPPDSSTATLRCTPLSLFLLMLFIWQPHYDPIFWGASDTDLMAYQMAWTPAPILFHNLTFELAIKPLRTHASVVRSCQWVKDLLRPCLALLQ